jgi:predicted RNA methylase
MVAYDEEFYSIQRAGSDSSARVVLPIIFDLIKPSSVIDVGCGVGTWLAVASELGATTVAGFEGEWAREANLAKPDLKIETGI